MGGIELSRPVWTLVSPVARASATILAVVFVLFTLLGASVGSQQIDPEATAVSALAQYIVTLLLYLLISSVFGVAILRTLLSEGATSGFKAFRQTPLKWIGFYFVVDFAIINISQIAGGLGANLGLVVLGIDPDSAWLLTIWVLLDAIVFLILAVFTGLLYPDVVATGRIQVGQAFQWGRRKAPVLLLLLLSTSFGPGFLASLLGWTWEVYSVDITTLALAEAVDHVIKVAVVMSLSILSSVLALIVLAKVYVDVIPPDERLDSRRISDVFD